MLLLRQTSTRFDDWLVCMVSSQLYQAEAGLDEPILPADPDFSASVLRLTRLAVLDGAQLVGSIGVIWDDRLKIVRQRLAKWIVE